MHVLGKIVCDKQLEMTKVQIGCALLVRFGSVFLYLLSESLSVYIVCLSASVFLYLVGIYIYVCCRCESVSLSVCIG